MLSALQFRPSLQNPLFTWKAGDLVTRAIVPRQAKPNPFKCSTSSPPTQLYATWSQHLKVMFCSLLVSLININQQDEIQSIAPTEKVTESKFTDFQKMRLQMINRKD